MKHDLTQTGARERLLPLLEALLSGGSTVEPLWLQFTASYVATPNEYFSEYDHVFFGAVNDKLHYTTWDDPSARDRRDELIGPEDFRAWLQMAVTEHKAGSFLDE